MSDDSFENGVLDALNAQMRCAMMTNAKGQIMIIHDQEITMPLEWIEYDTSMNRFSLVHEDGSIRELGLEINAKMQANLVQGTEVMLVHLVDKKIISTQKVSIMIMDY